LSTNSGVSFSRLEFIFNSYFSHKHDKRREAKKMFVLRGKKESSAKWNGMMSKM
jgi:hypothetical protein